MKTLSLAFGIMGILFLLLGLYIIFTTYTQDIFFYCFGGGLISTLSFLITQNLLKEYE
jgi:hypothetical protein